MPAAYAPIPIPSRAAGARGLAAEPAFSAPVRWTLAVLSWAAFLIASYLAFHSLTGISVAGCGVGETNGCDVVLSSSWSWLFGIPVAVVGLACYAALASLSVLMFIRSESVNRWATTIFTMLAVVAAGASAWFVGVQVFAIQRYCMYCLFTDALGIAIGVIATIAAVRSTTADRGALKTRTLQAGLLTQKMPPGASQVSAEPPSLSIVVAGAVPMLVLLVIGQTLFAAKTYEVQKVALNDAIRLDSGASETISNDDSSTATARTALRVPNEDEANGAAEAESSEGAAAPPNEPVADARNDASAGSPTTPESDVPPNSPATNKERIVKFLGGKLSLDVHKHPLLGSPDAPHIVVELISYDCEHCRKMYPLIEEARERYGDQVAILVLPVPLETDCNKLVTNPTASHRGACWTARAACGIAKLDPPAFAKFHEFLIAGKEKPPMDKIIPKSYGMVDGDAIRDLARSAELKKQVEGYIDLYSQLQAKSGSRTFGLPVQILGDHVMTGSVEKTEDLFKAWEQNLGVKPK